MNAPAATIEIQFDDALAATYPPRREVKQAVLVPVPDGVETVIVPEWGGEQKLIGSWYAIYNLDRQVRYGSGTPGVRRLAREDQRRREHLRQDHADPGAYRYRGEPAKVVTVLADGTVETDNTVTDGDWMVKWPAGEVGVLLESDIRKNYVID